MAEQVIDVNTGQIHLADGDVILRSAALGSCVGVAAYDLKRRIGAVAHIMLPGTAPADSTNKNRYASNAIEELLAKMVQAGSQKKDIEACIVGAGNVLLKEDDTICADNIKSVTKLLKDNNIPIRGAVVGGTERKSIFLDVQTGCVSYTQGDSNKKSLWSSWSEEKCCSEE